MATLVCLLGLSLSCAITTVAPQVEPAVTHDPGRVAHRPAPDTDPLGVRAEQEAVLAHLLRYQRRSGLTRGELVEVARTVVHEAHRHDLDPALVVAVIHVESRYDTYAVSTADALGLMQLLPSTGAWLAPTVGVAWRGPETLFDPVANIRLGVAYLRLLLDRYDGDIRTALLAYNWGPGRIDQRLRSGTPLPREYAQLVLTAYRPSS